MLNTAAGDLIHFIAVWFTRWRENFVQHCLGRFSFSNWTSVADSDLRIGPLLLNNSNHFNHYDNHYDQVLFAGERHIAGLVQRLNFSR